MKHSLHNQVSLTSTSPSGPFGTITTTISTDVIRANCSFIPVIEFT